ncbi:hypothetical protein BT69DRAFT_679667 [Atractiella rhizophila]|nr:hypothetical protein BT69DRAFT_679667 [Atractiella rhizophila]
MAPLPEHTPVLLDDILVLIFSSLSRKDLAKCCRVSLSWNSECYFRYLSLFHYAEASVARRLQRVSSNIANVRHLTLTIAENAGDCTFTGISYENPSRIAMFDALREVAPSLLSLCIDFDVLLMSD